MAKKISDSEKVVAHIATLNSPEAETVLFLRKVILEADPSIGEQIKWNSPSFYYTGDMKPFDPKTYKRDIVVINLHRGNLLLVFPTGDKIKGFDDFFEGNYPDGRRIAKIRNLDDAKANVAVLQKVLQDWILIIE